MDSDIELYSRSTSQSSDSNKLSVQFANSKVDRCLASCCKVADTRIPRVFGTFLFFVDFV